MQVQSLSYQPNMYKRPSFGLTAPGKVLATAEGREALARRLANNLITKGIIYTAAFLYRITIRLPIKAALEFQEMLGKFILERFKKRKMN